MRADSFTGRGFDLRWSALRAGALLLGLLVLAAGWGGGIDRWLHDARDEIRMHPASGQVAIVEIDAKSLTKLNRWPWPRRHHAELIDRLAGAQARLIAFDVNFEVRSNPVDDNALAAALERAGGQVALPTFLQYEGAGSSKSVEAIPHELFRNHAFLAGVNVQPEADGMVRRLPLGTETEATPRPSMASLLAESAGGIDEMLEIDYSIDPDTIPRFSFVDIIEGRFDPAAIAGKRLIVGGTAADMEDRYTVPLHGVLPGVVVQALAAETILAGGVAATGSGLWPLLLAVLIVAAAARPGRRGRRIFLFSLGASLLLGAPLATEHLFAWSFPIFPALVALLLAAAGSLALHYADQAAMKDPQTQLPNLRAMIAALEKSGPRIVVVARIDRFSALAAGLGPSASAALVQRVADRLRGIGQRVIYRSDDHSLAWTEALDRAGDLDAEIAGIIAAMRAPVECGRPVDVTIGVGIADPSMDAKRRNDPHQQAANAALAADRAIRSKLRFMRFADAEGDETGWHLSLLSELESAMAAGEVWNAYQPKLDIVTGRICGVETLVRWSHRERGLVGPDQFIPLVEAHGRAVELTAHVFGQALEDAARWRSLGHDLSVAVNVSATLLEDEAFIAWLGETLRESGVPPETVTVEVTESAAVQDVEQAAAALAGWRALGVAVSIDDYGTGQSSLGYLQRLPASELKVDKSFIQNIVADNRDAIMVSSTVALAHQLGMKVVAEGVEDAATLDLLREFGCDVAQGWLIGRPVPRDQLEAMLEHRPALAA